MPGLFRSAGTTEADRAANDRGVRAPVVLSVGAVLAIFAYLFSPAAQLVGAPTPRAAARAIGLTGDRFFDGSGALACHLAISLTQRFASDGLERLVLFGAAFVAFVASYFAPLAYKRVALVVVTIATLGVLYGPNATLALLLAHLVAYGLLHPAAASGGVAKALAIASAGALAVLAWPASHGLSAAAGAAAIAALGAGAPARRVAPASRWTALARTLAVESAIVVAASGALVEALTGRAWTLPLGILLFFWQWERLILYRIDCQDGRVPEDVPLSDYLAVFFAPGAIANWNWGVTIGQGYAYTTGGHLAEDKNDLVRAGLKLWGVALLYLILADPMRIALVAAFARIGIDVHGARTAALVAHFTAGGRVTTASVLLTTLLDLVRWLMLWGGVVHFKVGLWRICGYRVDPYFDRPWLATNLVSFWARFTFHYREFLVRAFYYPTFFRFFKRHKRLRIAVATFAAAGIGNLVWGHVTEGLFYHGLRFASVVAVLRTWPYFALLGAAIAVTELYLVGRRRTRKPWTFGPRLVLDVLAAYATLQFYALITIFARPAPTTTLADCARLVLVGLGIHLGR